MLLTTAERRVAIAGGSGVLAGISIFISFAVFMLLFATDGEWSAIFADPYILKILRFTLAQAILSTLLSILLGLPVALSLARQPHFPGRSWILRLMAIPMGLPALIGALGLVGVWGRQGWLNAIVQHGLGLEPISIYGLAGILLAHVFFNLPLACRLMLAQLERTPAEYWLTAGVLGMSPFSVFRLIEWPLLKRVLPGIAGLIFMLCAASFTLVLMLGGGPAATTIEVAIYQALRFDFDPARAVALCVLQVCMTGLILALMQFFAGAAEDGVTVGKRLRRLDGHSQSSKIIDSSVILAAVLFIGAPLLSIVISGLKADLMRLVGEALFWRALSMSLTISFLSAMCALTVSVTLIHARFAASIGERARFVPRLLLGGVSLGLNAASSFVLLIPPLVLATGWFMTVRAVGGDLDLAAPPIVILINMLMALPFVVRVLEPAYASHRARTLKLTASLGLVGIARLRLVDWPSLRGPLLIAFSFAMALSLGDLGAVALFGSDSFITLPWLIFSQLGNYRSDDAQGYAFLLAILCLALTMIGTRRATVPGGSHGR
ncbi:thiamine/thiamine pyrophosphate ABC transporter permease [Oryzifoliimicrobium ureilyticus]|uniref:thiamine/thiamine pyrophosphate ABC transporter permease n=1 Tax=Oryzifoliimicrobium ureilyticus TaxID=3113724 RepID=UPI003075F35B